MSSGFGLGLHPCPDLETDPFKRMVHEQFQNRKENKEMEEAKGTTQITGEFELMRKEIDLLNETVKMVNDRFRGVLEPPLIMNEEKKEEGLVIAIERNVPLAMELQALREHLKTGREFLQDIYAWCQI